MTKRFTTTQASEVGPSFSPAADFCVQVDSSVAVVVDVEAQADAAANWVGVASIKSDSNPLQPLTKLPFVRYRVRGNTAGNTVNVWDNG